MDAFYASIEQRDQPSLRGRPVAVGGDPQQRGVVAAASYEARAFGVRSAMPMARAVRLCPNLVIVTPRFEQYRATSQQIFALFRSVTPLVEPLALDEAYLDVTQNAWGETLGVRVATRLKQEIRDATGLTASAGVAPNKFLAKIASGLRKPDGLTVVAPERVEPFLQRLSVDDLWGVGPVTAQRLREAGLRTLVQLREAPEPMLRRLLGSQAERMRQLAQGTDERPVEPDRPRKSIGCETTYPDDLLDLDKIRSEVSALSREAAEHLRHCESRARTVTLKVRYDDFNTVTRSETSAVPIDSNEAITARALNLLERTDAGVRPLRLLGVSLHGLVDSTGRSPPEHSSGSRRSKDQLTLPLE
jgi:DNA polymerase-4